jgi:hypothetical protein
MYDVDGDIWVEGNNRATPATRPRDSVPCTWAMERSIGHKETHELAWNGGHFTAKE